MTGQMSLTDLANKYGTDKGDQHHEKHNYTPIYEKYMGASRNGLDLLEIGINDPRFPGSGMLMWLEWLGPFSMYYGIDINIDENLKNIERANEKRCELIYADQTKPDNLLRAIKMVDGISYIIDDGIHTFEAQVNSFFTLFPKLNKGGVYFIEDCHAKDCGKTVDLFKHLKRGAIGIDNIEFYNSDKLIVISKK